MREKSRLYRFFSFIILFSFIMTTSRICASGGWELILTTEIKSTDFSAGAPGFSTVGFFNETHGIAVGHHGEIRYTVDGGKYWPKANYPSFGASLDGLEILNADWAWCGGGNFVRVTTDGGKNWSALPDYVGHYTLGRYLSFINRQIGWFGTVNQVAETKDGGITWDPIPVPENAGGNITAVHLLAENIGFILLNSGTLYRTDNGGRTWNPIRLPLKGRKPIGVIPYAPVEAVRFQDEMHGIVVLYAEKPRGFYILETGDGGKQWREERLPRNSRVTLGNVFLSRDGRYLTINDIDHDKILLFKHD